LGAGFTYNRGNDSYSPYGEPGVSSSLQNFGDSYDVRGNLGIRVSW